MFEFWVDRKRSARKSTKGVRKTKMTKTKMTKRRTKSRKTRRNKVKRGGVVIF